MRIKPRTIADSDLRDLLVNPKLNNRGQYICDCIFCGKESHMYVNKETQLFDCKKCGEHGNIYKILKQLDKTYLLEGSTVEVRETIQSIRKLISESLEEELETLKDLPIVNLPAGWKIPLTSTKYLLSRGITSEDCKRYKIGTTNLYHKYKDYVLIPIYDNKKIRGFVGRYGSKIVPKGKLRYNNSAGTKFSELLFGYDEITNKTLTVILVEGIFDKIKVDKVLRLNDGDEIKCVCTFGKKISKEQIKKIILKGVTNVVLLYDFDAIKDIKKYGLELEYNFFTSIIYTSDKKDIDEYTDDEEALKVFMNLKKPRDFIDDVIGKLKK